MTPTRRAFSHAPARTGLFLVLLCSFTVVAVQAMRRGGPPVEMSFLSFFASFAYASVGVHYFLSSNDAAAGRLTGGIILAIVAVDLALLAITGTHPVWPAKWSLVAIGALGLLGYTREIITGADAGVRRERIGRLRDALIVPLAVVQVPFFLWSNAQINPVYDARVYGFEDLLGIPFSYLAMKSYDRLAPISLGATLCYLALPIGLSVIAVKQRSSEAVTRVILAVVAAGVCGFALYSICPVVGPVQAFAAPFPTRLPKLAASDLAPLWVTGRVPRNGMPSLHTVWALLIVVNSISFGWRWRTALAVFAALNIWAAMGAYQHWFIDLVVAVPLAAAIQMGIVSVWASAPGRWGSVASCATLTILWLLGLRHGLFLGSPPWLAWGAVGLTVALPLWALRPQTQSSPPGCDE